MVSPEPETATFERVLPAVIPGFQSINRYWDAELNLPIAKIQPGEYYVGNQVEGISTVLGSCIAVCIRDELARIGGMNHFMLPIDKKIKSSGLVSIATRYGNYAMEHLINDILRLGGQKDRFEIKLFGGANINSSSSNVGDKNIEFVRGFIKTEGYSIASLDVGGKHPRRILYSPLSGKILLKRLPIMSGKKISKIEKNYNNDIATKPVAGKVDLF